MAERIIIIAVTASAIPATEIPEMMLITLVDFFEKRYRRAMKNGVRRFFFCNLGNIQRQDVPGIK